MIGYIYQIINNITQERYVGQTINLTKRLSDHRNKLKQNKHSNPKLQAAWNKYGIDNFSFNYDEYEIKNTNDLNQLEIDTIKKYDSYRGFPDNVKLPMNRDAKTNFGIKNLWNRNEKWKNY